MSNSCRLRGQACARIRLLNALLHRMTPAQRVSALAPAVSVAILARWHFGITTSFIKTDFPVSRCSKAKIYLFLLFAVCLNPLAVASDVPSRSQLTVAESLADNKEVRLFTEALKTSGLWQNLLDSKQVTLLLPTDRALRYEGAAFLLEQVLIKPENSERLVDLMAQHIYPGVSLRPESFDNSTTLKNGFGGCVSIVETDKNTLRVGPEALVTSHLSYANGEIFFIDRLLWQPYLEENKCL